MGRGSSAGEEATAWSWDESLYGGSAPYYAAGRLPYPGALAEALRAELGLDGRGRLLDAGCGPGSLSLLLAPLFEEVVGLDADAAMLAEAARVASRRGIANVRWLHMRAEDLPGGIGAVRVATFAQSFHWMDRERVTAAVAGMLEPDGAWVHVNATTHQGVGDAPGLPAPQPPRERITRLIQAYLGPARRAGRRVLGDGTPAGEEGIMLAAGFRGPSRIRLGEGRVLLRSEDEVVASVYSLSWAAPHLFAGRLEAFEADLRALLRSTAADGRFAERAREIELVVWRPPHGR